MFSLQYTGLMVYCWSIGLKVYRPTSLLVCHSAGLLVYWFTADLLVYWFISLLVCWSASLLVY